MIFRRLYSICCSLIFASVLQANDIDVRLNPSFYDEDHAILYVDIELKYKGQGIWVLADQNYRMYFDASNLKFIKDDYFPDLPHDKYGKVEFIEIIENAVAPGVGSLKFDDQLGFLNFNVDLLDDNHGGIRITPKDGWSKVVTLRFKLVDPEKLNEIVWSSRGQTDEYATAFIEIMEWKAPQHIVPAEIDQYVNAAFEHKVAPERQISIGPNPAADYVLIEWSQPLDKIVDIKISDLSGHVIMTKMVRRNLTAMRLDISELPIASYMLSLYDGDRLIQTKNIVKAD